MCRAATGQQRSRDTLRPRARAIVADEHVGIREGAAAFLIKIPYRIHRSAYSCCTPGDVALQPEVLARRPLISRICRRPFIPLDFLCGDGDLAGDRSSFTRRSSDALLRDIASDCSEPSRARRPQVMRSPNTPLGPESPLSEGSLTHCSRPACVGRKSR
jgi:hypothetical protein